MYGVYIYGISVTIKFNFIDCNSDWDIGFIIGIIFFIVYLRERKKKTNKGFFIAAIILLCISIPMSSVFPALIITDSYSTVEPLKRSRFTTLHTKMVLSGIYIF